MKGNRHKSDRHRVSAEGTSGPMRRKKGPKGRGHADGGRRGKGSGHGKKHGRPLGRGQLKYLLLDLASKEPRHGYELMAEIELRTDGAYKPSPGVTYPTIELMNDLGWIILDTKEDKRLIKITELGREELAANEEILSDLYSRLDEVKQRSIGTEPDDVRMLMRKLRHTMKTKIVENPDTRETIAQLISDTNEKVVNL